MDCDHLHLNRQKALNVTGNRGVEPAMEWLFAHSDDVEIAPECVSADSTNATESTSSSDMGAEGGASSSSTNDSMQEVKSFKCEEW